MSKKATIIIPVYNGEQFLARSVRDIFRQTYEDVEFAFRTYCRIG